MASADSSFDDVNAGLYAGMPFIWTDPPVNGGTSATCVIGSNRVLQRFAVVPNPPSISLQNSIAVFPGLTDSTQRTGDLVTSLHTAVLPGGGTSQPHIVMATGDGRVWVLDKSLNYLRDSAKEVNFSILPPGATAMKWPSNRSLGQTFACDFDRDTNGAAHLYFAEFSIPLYKDSGGSEKNRVGELVLTPGNPNWSTVLGDMNRDGDPELLVGAHGNDRDGRDAGLAVLVSGRTRRPLYRFYPGFAGAWLGWRVSGGEDLNRDGIVDGIVSVLYGPKGSDGKWAPEWIYAFAGNDLFLQASDTSVAPGETVNLDTRGGEASAMTLLVLTEVSGTTMFVPLMLGALDGNGESTFIADAPAGASGLEFTLRAYAQKHAGGSGIIDSSKETVTVE